MHSFRPEELTNSQSKKILNGLKKLKILFNGKFLAFQFICVGEDLDFSAIFPKYGIGKAKTIVLDILCTQGKLGFRFK